MIKVIRIVATLPQQNPYEHSNSLKPEFFLTGSGSATLVSINIVSRELLLVLGSGYCTVQLTSIILKKFGFIAFCCAGDLLAGFGGVSAVDSPQRSNTVSPGNPWDLSALDPMTGLQPLSAQVWGPGGQAEALELIALL